VLATVLATVLVTVVATVLVDLDLFERAWEGLGRASLIG